MSTQRRSVIRSRTCPFDRRHALLTSRLGVTDVGGSLGVGLARDPDCLRSPLCGKGAPGRARRVPAKPKTSPVVFVASPESGRSHASPTMHTLVSGADPGPSHPCPRRHRGRSRGASVRAGPATCGRTRACRSAWSRAHVGVHPPVTRSSLRPSIDDLRDLASLIRAGLALDEFSPSSTSARPDPAETRRPAQRRVCARSSVRMARASSQPPSSCSGMTVASRPAHGFGRHGGGRPSRYGGGRRDRAPARGAPSPTHRPAARACAAGPPTCAEASSPRSASAATPTRRPRSPEPCSAPARARPAYRRTGSPGSANTCRWLGMITRALSRANRSAPRNFRASERGSDQCASLIGLPQGSPSDLTCSSRRTAFIRQSA